MSRVGREGEPSYRLSVVARALAIATVRLGAEAGLARLVGADAEAARGIVAGGASRDEAARASVTAARPPGWRHVDPSWIDHALAGEDADVRAIVIGDRDDPLARWLARWFLGALVPMPEPGPARGVDELPRLPARALVRTLDALGRRQLAHAVAAATPSEQHALAARLPWGRALAGEIAAVRSLGDAAVAQLGSRRSAAQRTSGLPWTDAGAPMSAGLRALAPRVHDRGELAAQLAQRLPRVLGAPALLELRGPFALAPADTVAAVEIERAIARGSVAS